MFASDDCSKVLVAAHCTQLFLWQHDTSQTYLDGQDHTLVGRWSKVVAPEGMMMPGYDCQEACLQAVFASSSVRYLFTCYPNKEIIKVYISSKTLPKFSYVEFSPIDPNT